MKIEKLPKLLSDLELLPFEIKDQKVYINYFGGVQAGFPSPAEDFHENKLSLDEKYITHPNSTYLLRVRGNSMFPTLQKDDILIVRSDLDLEENKIAIISINNSEYSVKRYSKKENRFIPDNLKYEPITVDENDVVVVLGIVKQLIRDF
jgi:DNA polymerase V